MAGTTVYPGSIDNKTALQDGIDIIQADDVNDSYVMCDGLETMIGTIGAGKTQSSSTDLLEFLSNMQAPVCVKKDANTITIKAGALLIKNAGQSNRMMRRNTADVNIVAGNLDTGAMADATYYYIYAVADSTATTFTVKFSLSATAPTGLTNFELIGWFYNQAAGSLTITDGYVGNNKANGRGVPNKASKESTVQVSSASTTAVDDTEATLKFISSGRPVRIVYNLAGAGVTATTGVAAQISVDAADITATMRHFSGYGVGATDRQLLHCETILTLAAGAHTIQGRFYNHTALGTGTAYVNARIISAIED